MTRSGARSMSRSASEIRLSTVVQPERPAFTTSTSPAARRAPSRAGQVSASSVARTSNVVDPPAQTIRYRPAGLGIGTSFPRYPRAFIRTEMSGNVEAAPRHARDDEVRVAREGSTDLPRERRPLVRARHRPRARGQAAGGPTTALEDEEQRPGRREGTTMFAASARRRFTAPIMGRSDASGDHAQREDAQLLDGPRAEGLREAVRTDFRVPEEDHGLGAPRRENRRNGGR